MDFSAKFDAKKVKEISNSYAELKKLKRKLQDDLTILPDYFRDDIVYAVTQGRTNTTYHSSKDIDTSVLTKMGFIVQKTILDVVDRAGNHTKEYFVSWE